MQFVKRFMRFVKRSSKLKKLEFLNSTIDTELLEDILQIPEALDTLIYEIAGDWIPIPNVGLGHINPPAFARALRQQINITTLSVTIVSGDETEVQPMGSIRDFTSLKTLIIPCLYLLGDPDAINDRRQDRNCVKFFDLLPPNLV